MQALRAASSGARSVPLTYSRTELLQFSPPSPSRRLFPLAYKSCTCSLLSFSGLPLEPAPSSALPFRKTPAGAVLVLSPALSPSNQTPTLATWPLTTSVTYVYLAKSCAKFAQLLPAFDVSSLLKLSSRGPFSKSGGGRELHPGVLGPLLPPQSPYCTYLLFRERGPNAWPLPV